MQIKKGFNFFKKVNYQLPIQYNKNWVAAEIKLMRNYEFIAISSSQEPRSMSSSKQSSKRAQNKKTKKRLSSSDKISLENNDSSSSEFDQSTCKNMQMLKFFNMKTCEQCLRETDGKNMLLCDKCDDGYHTYCLPQECDPFGHTFICPKCILDEKEISALQKNIEPEVVEIVETMEEQNCTKCKKLINHQKIQRVYFGENLDCVEICFQDQFNKQQCLYCKKYYHFDCFNIRTNALNCSTCEKEIRKNCPKGHKKFMDYYKNKYENFQQHKFFKLTSLHANLRSTSIHRYPKANLKLPSPVTNWQFIAQYQASIYYAFETKKLNFIEQQIYDDKKVMGLNRWDGQCIPIIELHEDDQKVFEMFKQNTTNGIIVGPYEIKQDRIKGFHIVATDFIEKMTIITEYVGEVVTSRRSLFHHGHNDSVFSLIKNPRSCLSLDIVPQNFGNISRFFSGINNNKSESRKSLNIQAKKFSYKGRVRIIFYALKDIQAGDELLFDYNGGLFHEYPTDNFKV